MKKFISETKMDAFDNFVKQRLEKRSESADVLADLKKEYFKARILEVLKELHPDISVTKKSRGQAEFSDLLKDLGISIITIRTAFNKDSKLLKPIATFPDKRLAIAEKIATQHTPQKFKNYKDALEGIPNHFPQAAPDELDSKGAIHFSGLYKTDGNYKKQRKDKIIRFDFRIDAGFSMMREGHEKEFGSESLCFFSVKAKVVGEKTKRGPGRPPSKEYLVSQIIAIYLDVSIKISDPQLAKAHDLCQTIFEEFEQIKQIDNELFELEGHELTSSLQPLFLDEDIAPSDKIAFSIEQLKKLLNRHLKSHYPSTTDNLTNVYFVSLAYEVNENKPKELTPIFQVYPHVYRTELPYASFIIGHPEYPSVSKYLLRNYFKQYYKNLANFSGFVVGQTPHGSDPSINISKNFMTDMFKSVDQIINKNERSKKLLEVKDQIFISKKLNATKEPDRLWEILNVDVQAGGPSPLAEKNNSILAYVIEGHDIDQHRTNGSTENFKQLPRAILAIESTQCELLSDREQESLRVVAKAFSHLVRHLFHANTLLDYRPQLSSAYRKYSYRITEKPVKKLANRFILSSMSVDASLFSVVLDNAEVTKKFSETLIRKLKNVQKCVYKGTEINDKQVEINPDLVKDRLSKRFSKAVSFIQSVSNYPNEDVVHFIEACPKNFAWAGYMPSLAQALGDRADNSPPKFELMTTGFSATGLYMALVRSEIRQVAKLSSVSKLKKERNNYLKYVRYKVLVAARSPNNAFAFDSTGQHGKDCGKESDSFEATSCYEGKCYGVLVSDLASARKLEPKDSNGNLNFEEVSTFLDKVALAIEETAPDQETAKTGTIESIIPAIKSLFRNNLGHWYSTPTLRDLKNDTTRGVLLNGYRLNYKKKLKDKLRPEEHGKEETLVVFNRLLYGLKGAMISNQEKEFPFKEHSLQPEKISAFINYDYTHPLPLELLDEDSSLELLSIAHRDLNAQNLVWAGSIQSLMMIDFEHVGLGFWGMDQARLAVNTVVDILSVVGTGYSQDFDFEKKALSVEKAANFIASQWSRYQQYKNENNLDSLIKFDEQYKNSTENILKGIVKYIIRETWWGNHEILLKSTHLGVFQACLGYAVVKEYEYAMINVRCLEDLKEKKVSTVNKILGSHKSLKKQLIKLYKSENFNHESPQGRNELATISKYFVAYYILKEISKGITFSDN